MFTTTSPRLVVALVATLGASIALPVSAQLGGRPAEEWAITLESGRRLASLEVQEVVDQMNLESGEVVADIGAGTGVFSVPMARAVVLLRGFDLSIGGRLEGGLRALRRAGDGRSALS